jgi:CHAD domain-containing protein
MNSNARTGGAESQSLRDRLTVWRELLAECMHKPARKRVHSLRVVTLRIQAEVEHEVKDLPAASHEAQAMLRFGKLANKLRDALGVVRELDVWIGKLRKLRESLSGTVEYVPRSTRETIRQIARLEDRLARKRERAGLKLAVEIKKRHQDLLSAAQDLEGGASGRAHEVDANQAAMLLEEFTQTAADFPVFDESNLHDFRKRIKTIRYLAEVHHADPGCERIAAQMRKAQSAVGEWHDWQVLARTASRGKHAKAAEVAELLNNLAAEAYESAISICHGVVLKMSDLNKGGGAGFEHVRKAPVRSENRVAASVRKLA